MKRFIDYLPLIVFFIVYKIYDIYYASGALIVASAMVLVYTWLRYGRVPKIALIAFILLAIFSSLTLYYHNTEFIKWKVTVIYTLFAAALLISQFALGQPLIKCILNKEICLPERVWDNLNVAWAAFCLACGVANIYIVFWLSQSAWVNFKVFGLTGLTLVFMLLSVVYIHRHIVVDKQNNNDR